MKHVRASCMAVLVLWGTARAHRLDECLQATRLKFETNGVSFRIDITPGVAVATEFLERLDTDHDGSVSTAEEAAYGESMLGELSMFLDDQPLKARLTRVNASPMDELKAGNGSLRLGARVDLESLAAGQHHLTLTNRHLPTISVHLVNALQPADPRLEIRTQLRSRDQREYRVDFDLRAISP